MPTLLEVIDTVAKVGLGGLITAVAGYVGAQRSFTNEREKERRTLRVDLLREALVKLEQCGTVLNENVSDARQMVLKPRADRGERTAALAKQSVGAFNLCREARTLALLAGQSDIGRLLGNYARTIEPLPDLYLYEDDETLHREMQRLQEERTAIKNSILELIPSLL